MLVQQGLLGHAYFAVFDCHAGMEAANYAKCHLFGNIVQHPLCTKYVSKAIGEGIITTGKNFCSKADEEVSVLKFMLGYICCISVFIAIMLFIVYRICVVALRLWLAW